MFLLQLQLHHMHVRNGRNSLITFGLCATGLLQGVKPGTRLANSFSTVSGFIVCGFNGTAVTQDCSPGTKYNPSIGGCQATSAAAAAEATAHFNLCANATDGVHAYKNNTGGYQVSTPHFAAQVGTHSKKTTLVPTLRP